MGQAENYRIFLVFDSLGMITNKSDFANRTKQFLVQFPVALYYLGTSKLKIEGYKILSHENLRIILRHAVPPKMSLNVGGYLTYSYVD